MNVHHRLAPDFIIEKLEQQETNGRFPGSAMFLDVSGFSSIMDTLMQHGQHGSEIMATLMRSLFEPLVLSVFTHEGYIVGFAGDAFTAVFPDTVSSPSAALMVARKIQQHLAQHDHYQTEYGDFPIGIKIGLAYGEIEWGILQSTNRQRATFFYTGDAIQNCIEAEHAALKQDVICHPSIMPGLPSDVVAEPLGEYFRITAVETAVEPAVETPVPSTAVPSMPKSPPPPPNNVETVSKFFPKQLVTQSISGEFRQIFNLFINLKGTPPLDQLANFMETVFGLQDQYGGLLNRIDFGDKGCHFLFFWGAPVSYENDLSRVLEFVQALELNSPLKMRIGITYRIAHAGFIGSPLHEEYTCYGRGVNLAARFMTSANWGEIWVDAEIASRARHLFRFEFLGEQAFKGFAEPQAVYQLLNRRQVARAPFYEGQLVGRNVELSQLEAAAQPLLNGRFAGVVVIGGDAGIGKSRLVYEFLERLTLLEPDEGTTVKPAIVFRCQTDEIMRQSLNPFRYWLRDYFAQSPTINEAENKTAFNLVLDTLREKSAVSPALSRELNRTRSILGALVGLFWPGSLYENLEPQLRFENSLNALKTLIKAESARQPIILQIEDAQWFDEDSWHFLKLLTRNIESIPLLVIMTSRAPFPADALEKNVPLTSLNLDNLSLESASDLVTERTGHPPDPHFLDWLLERTEGNPFFVEQMLYYLKENKLLDQSMHRFDVSTSAGMLPTDVRSVLTARLDSLPSAVKEVVQTASVLGREFDRPVVVEMLKHSEQIHQNLETATEESIWVVITQIRYLFRHMLLRDAAYNMQVQSQLKTLHHRAASAYETIYAQDLTPYFGQIAYHYDQAVITVKALAYYEKAADQARENYQNEAALDHYNRALSLTRDHEIETRYRLLLGKEAILNWLGQRDEQESCLSQLEQELRQTPDPQKRSELALRQAAFALNTTQYEKAVAAARLSAETAVAAQDPLAEARAYHRWGRAYWQQSQHNQAAPYTQKAFDLAKKLQARDIEAQCLYDLAVIHYFNSEPDESISRLQQSFDIYQTINDKPGAIRCLNLFGLLYDHAGLHSKAKEQYELALTYCNEIGWRYGAARIMIQIGNNLLMLGDYPHSEHYHANAYAICRELNDLEGQSASLDTLGLVHFFQAMYTEAKQQFVQSIDLALAHHHKRNLGYPSLHLGYCLIELKEYDEAENILENTLQIRQDLEDEGGVIDTLNAQAKLAFRQGKEAAAVQLVQKVLDFIESSGTSSIEFPVLVYLDSYDILSQSSDRFWVEKSKDILKSAYQLLLKQADEIQEDKVRQQFLTAVPYNQRLQQLWQTRQAI